MENTEYYGYISTPEDKEAKARRELETNKLMTDQAKRKNAEMQEELAAMERRRREISNRILQNGREIRAYADREETLTQFLALAEEI